MDFLSKPVKAILVMKSFLYVFFLLVIFSCKTDSPTSNKVGKEVGLKYAKGFIIEEIDDFKVITLNDAWRGEKTTYKYLLYKNDEPEGFADAIKIKIPIKSIVCMSLTHIAFIDALNEQKTIIGVSGGKYTNNPKIKSLIDTKSIVEIGVEQTINYELLVEKNPHLVMAYGIDGTSTKYTSKLLKLGLTTVLNAEYMEVHPLGKAEWIKFVAAFYDKENLANRIFNSIEKEYLSLLSKTENIAEKPTVFVGMPWNGNWYVAGGKSFQAQLFKDAGANYLWNNNEEKSSVIKSKELVYNDALEADFWLNVNSYSSISSILSYDERLKNFSALKDSLIYNNDNRINEFTGNEYWESGTINPHIVLKDLIEIFHPDVLEHELYYYRRLK